MAKQGIVGVGSLSIKMSAASSERPMQPKEDVYELLKEAVSPKDVSLIFRPASATNNIGGGNVFQQQPPQRALPARDDAENNEMDSGDSDDDDDDDEGDSSLQERVIEQDRMIGSLRKQVQQLRQIEKEQQRIIDSQSRKADVSASPMKSAMEIDRVRMELEEEKAQHEYAKIELKKLRVQKAEYLRRMKAAGLDVVVMDQPRGMYGRQGHDDNPEDLAGCDTNTCLIQ